MCNLNRRILICEFIANYISVHGKAPTVREIGEAIGVTSTSTVAGYLNRLVRDGRLRQEDASRRKYYISAA